MNMSSRRLHIVIAAMLAMSAPVTSDGATTAHRVRIKAGTLASTVTEPGGVWAFRGIPFAAPPIGELRWQAPQPLKAWRGVRNADKFSAGCAQNVVFADVIGRGQSSSGESSSEDCLYLNVWTSAKSARERLPVLVYIYGGGYSVGDASEARYDGANMAKQGMVVVTANYRLGVFGFLAHPELSKATRYGGSGNYALLDQVAALQWVRDNIGAFGGDPKRVTIAGESAGSISVSALMASPLSRNLIAGAIGESGSMMGSLTPRSLAESEAAGQEFAKHVGAQSLEQLRGLPTQQLLQAARTFRGGFAPTIDGYFLPKPLQQIYQAGEQAKVPLLAGSNSEERTYAAVLGAEPATVSGYRNALAKLYGDKAEAVFQLYPAQSDGDAVLDAAQQLAGDRFIGQSTWRWVDRAAATGGKPVFYYYYTRLRPPFTDTAAPMLAERQKLNPSPMPPSPPPRGAVHSAEIEYALGNLDVNPLYQWQPADYQVSRTLQNYFVNFIKNGNPNGAGLQEWQTYDTGMRMAIDVDTKPIRDFAAARGRAMDELLKPGL